jgi:hypothetical protein
MSRRCSGNGLMLAGLIVLLVGLAVGLAAALRVPGHWMPALVGAALFLVGALRWAIRRDRPPADSERR